MKRRLLLIAISITVAASGVLPVYAATVKKHAVSSAGSELQEDEILLNSAPDSSGLGEDAMKGVAPADEADVFIAAPYAAEAAGSAETTAAVPAVAETAAETEAATEATTAAAETEAETESVTETVAETEAADVAGPGAALSGSGDSEASGETASSETGLRSLGIFTTTGYYNNTGQASADGSWPRVGHTVSADWSVLPPGTRIKFGDSDIIYTVEDCGVHGNWVDVYYETSSQANSHGLQYKEVFLVE